MRKYKMTPIHLFFLGLFMVSFIFGYQIIGKKVNPTPNNTSQFGNKDVDLSDYPDLEILREHDRISPNTLIEERIHHTSCNHVITRINSVEDELVNMSKVEFKEHMEENYPNKKLISYSTNKITMGVVKNHLCEKHYVIGEENGKIAIFKIGQNGESILDKIFLDYPISLLMEIDQEKITEGIIVDSEEELSEILENFIS